jgi:transcriptional regulator with XRE-family HTH domain
MDGRQIVKIIDDRLAELGMTQKEFCAQLGIQSSAMSMWRKGSMPKPERLKQIEKCLGISFADYEKSDPRDELREDLRILLHSASDLPPSSVYELIAEIHKRKEMGKVDSSS